MKKNVLLISASGRKGKNTDTLCDQFALGAETAGHSVEKIFVSDMELKFCIGCRTCKENGGSCIHRDDMADALDQMLNAHVIVFATPVYFWNMNGQLKTFIDRTYPKYPAFKGKKFYFILSGGGEYDSMYTTIQGYERYLDLIGEVERGGILFGRAHPDNVYDTESHAARGEAFEAGKNI